MKRDLDLGGPWKFRQVGRTGLRVKRWLPAAVPGTVHTDLLAAGAIEDPFFRANECEQRWVEYADWHYQREFRVQPEFLADARAVWLDFDGLDTLATVRLNGQEIGRASNMFHPWRFDAKPLIRPGVNELEVEFASAPRAAEELAAKSRTQYRAPFYTPRVWLRKAQYSGGWDWAPRFLTCGIWRLVRLRVVTAAEIRNVHARTSELNERRAVLTVDVEIEAHVSGRATVRANLRRVGVHLARLRLVKRRAVKRMGVHQLPRGGQTCPQAGETPAPLWPKAAPNWIWPTARKSRH